MSTINIKEHMEVTPIIEIKPVDVCLEKGQAALCFKERSYADPKSIERGDVVCSPHAYSFILSLYHRHSDLLLLSITKSQLIDFYINKSAKFQSYGCVNDSFTYQYRNGIIQRGYWSNDDCMVVKVGVRQKILRGLFCVEVVGEILTPEQIYQLFMRAAESLFELTFNHKPIQRL